MICGHCQTPISAEWKTAKIIETSNFYTIGKALAYIKCPSCGDPIVALKNGSLKRRNNKISLSQVYSTDIIYPKPHYNLQLEYVPHTFAKDYKEAKRILTISTQGSAVIVRRILQNILHEIYNIKRNSLYKEIEAFRELPGIPFYIVEAVDAIRSIGNFAAHPSKDQETGEIVGVDKAEAEWLIELLEYLFDYLFIHPKKLEKRKESLNKKLKKIGKSPIKSAPGKNI